MRFELELPYREYMSGWPARSQYNGLSNSFLLTCYCNGEIVDLTSEFQVRFFFLRIPDDVLESLVK